MKIFSVKVKNSAALDKIRQQLVFSVKTILYQFFPPKMENHEKRNGNRCAMAANVKTKNGSKNTKI